MQLVYNSIYLKLMQQGSLSKAAVCQSNVAAISREKKNVLTHSRLRVQILPQSRQVVLTALCWDAALLGTPCTPGVA